MDHSSNKQLQLALCRTDASWLLATSTKIKYRSALIAYLDFCHEENVSTFPSEETFCRFISVSCRRPSRKTGKSLSPRSVEAYLSGIANGLLDTFPNIRSITNSHKVRTIMKGCKRQFSKPIKRKDPLSLDDIIMVHSGSDSSHDDRLFVALITIGFHALHRLGEITQPDSTKLRDERKVIARNTVRFSNCQRYVQYTLPHNKSDQFFLGAQVLIAKCDIVGALVDIGFYFYFYFISFGIVWRSLLGE